MASKSSSTGPNSTTTAPTKQARSRKAAAPQAGQDSAGRAGSAGGVVLDKQKEEKGSEVKTKSKATTATGKGTAAPALQDEAPTNPKQPRRKPRKLNKETSATPTTTPGSASTAEKSGDSAAAVELEALKSRVRGLESKVEQLYLNGTLERPSRSPRRRGKGRKNSSQQQVPTLSSTTPVPKVQDPPSDNDEEEADEELVRLEDELEVARQDLAQYRPRNRRTGVYDDDDEEGVEEIPRSDEGGGNAGSSVSKHVTLSGSYRIPLPAAVNTEDLKTIQSGVSAAQNLARGFLEQRRAASLQKSQNTTQPSTSASQPSKKPARPRPVPRSVSSSMSVIPAEDADGGKKSWSEWIGGYSVAITRAVKSIEHEAAVESQRGSASASGNGSGNTSAAPNRIKGAAKKPASAGTGKRPGVKTKLSGEQVHGLMS
jgi:hypothetical protein